jgi:hypothetical protein
MLGDLGETAKRPQAGAFTGKLFAVLVGGPVTANTQSIGTPSIRNPTLHQRLRYDMQ